ncbi:molybdate ABC transporter substrate-binding protein [Thermoleophilia bacterium SCSIO 60948]|nr:molybdate ABC transporter substrate-binding protein [Thermoleophilia bacterium SCSIO 60948]
MGLAIGLTGCGEDSSSGAEASGELRVSAAASLTDAFETYGDQDFPDASFSFAGSDELAAQIRQGAPVDVFASANTTYPDELYDEGLVERPVEFVTNEMVIGVPTGSEIDSIDDLAEPGVDVVLGTPDVPFGAYAREVLGRLPQAEEDAILANVRSEESDVTAAVGKLAQGAADASLVYSSDVAGASGEIEGAELPEDLQPVVTYGVAVVSETENAEGAQAFVAGLTEPEGQRILTEAGFGPAPGR